MIPELFDFGLHQRRWMEKETAISYAQMYLCVSESTRRDLLAFYPEIPVERVLVAHCGVDEAVFGPRDGESVARFRERFGLDRPYFLFVGSLGPMSGYKNSQLLFDALGRMGASHFDVFCVGGDAEIEPRILASLPAGVRCRRVELADDELALAYNGAVALVCPSLYEGLGMAVIEAMACGCPVVTTGRGALAEAAGDAAHLISGTSVEEMCRALERVQQDGAYRRELREKGLAQVRQFRWEEMARVFSDAVGSLAHGSTDVYEEFFAEWRRLRELQASVDCEL